MNAQDQVSDQPNNGVQEPNDAGSNAAGGGSNADGGGSNAADQQGFGDGGAPPNIQDLAEGVWPGNNDGGSEAGPPPPPEMSLEEQLAAFQQKAATLEKQASDAEREKNDLEGELERTRDLLYEKEGHKTVSHITDLERENRRLRHDLAKAKDQAIYHQSAHMTTMDDLVKLKQNIDTQGSYTQLKSDYDLLRYELNRLTATNTDLALRLAESQDAVEALKKKYEAEKETGHRSIDTASAGPGASSLYLSGGAGLILLNTDRGYVTGASPFSPSRDAELAAQQEQEAADQKTQNYNNNASVPRGGPKLFGTTPAGKKKTSEDAANGENSENKIPTVSSILDQHGHLGTENALGGQDIGHGWRTLTLENGQIVYHNSYTNKSQWDVPTELIRKDDANVNSAFASNLGAVGLPVSLL